MNTYKEISISQKPILFHSGILWDGRNSAKYNRPGEFECLLEIPNLRFCLAHVSWPWCDECIAVYGKLSNATYLRDDVSCEAFIDITPGTPPIWREEVFKKLFCAGYDVSRNVIFGSDCSAHNYNVKWTNEWIARDREIFSRLGLSDNEEFLSHIYEKNLLRFLGVSDEKVTRSVPMVAE